MCGLLAENGKLDILLITGALSLSSKLIGYGLRIDHPSQSESFNIFELSKFGYVLWIGEGEVECW